MSDQKPEVKREGKLPRHVHFSYFYQEFSMGFLTNLGTQYFPFFMTDIAMIPAALVATVMLIGRIADTFSVFVAGLIIQLSNFKKGKFTTWLFIAVPICIIFNMGMFVNYPFPLGVKAALLGASYILAFFFVNFCSTARFSIATILTDDPGERTILSSRRTQGSSAGQIVRGAIFIPMVMFITRLSGGSQTLGYFFSALVFGLIAISGMYWIASIARPYEAITQAKEGPRPTLKDMGIQMITNKPLLILVVAESFRGAAAQVNTTNNMYYFRYITQNLLMMPVFLTVTFFVSFFGATLVSFISKRVDKIVTYFIGGSLYVLALLAAYIFAYGNVWIYMVTMCFARFGTSIAASGTIAYFSDTADYGELQQGRNIRAINMGLMLLTLKLSVLIGGSIQAYRLAAVGFRPGTTDPTVLQGIHTTATLFSAIAMLVPMALMIIYPLKKKKVLEIQAALKEKKAAAAQQTPQA